MNAKSSPQATATVGTIERRARADWRDARAADTKVGRQATATLRLMSTLEQPIMCGQSRLAEVLELPPRTLERHLDVLHKAGLLEMPTPRKERFDDGTFRSANGAVTVTAAGRRHLQKTAEHRPAILAGQESIYVTLRESERIQVPPPAKRPEEVPQFKSQDSVRREEGEGARPPAALAITRRARPGINVDDPARPSAAGRHPPWAHRADAPPALELEFQATRRRSRREAIRRACPENWTGADVARFYRAYGERVRDLPATAALLSDRWGEVVQAGFAWRTDSPAPERFESRFACAHVAEITEMLDVMENSPREFTRRVRRSPERSARAAKRADERRTTKVEAADRDAMESALAATGYAEHVSSLIISGKDLEARYLAHLATTSMIAEADDCVAKLWQASMAHEMRKAAEMWDADDRRRRGLPLDWRNGPYADEITELLIAGKGAQAEALIDDGDHTPTEEVTE